MLVKADIRWKILRVGFSRYKGRGGGFVKVEGS